jgi:DNA-binding NarL/FixJ family response regulator
MPLRILIVDDEAPARDELRYLLESIGDVDVCGEANCAEDGVNLAREIEPDLIFLDIMMEDMDGLSAAREILADGR